MDSGKGLMTTDATRPAWAKEAWADTSTLDFEGFYGRILADDHMLIDEEGSSAADSVVASAPHQTRRRLY